MTYSRVPQGGYGIISRLAMRMPNVTKESKAVYALLCSYTGDKEFCFPSIETMAKDLGTSHRSIKRYIAELIAVGLIAKSKKNPHGWNRSNSYYIQAPNLHEAISDPIDSATSDPIKQAISDPLIITTNNNKRITEAKASTPSLTRKVSDIFSKGFRALEQEELVWKGKEKPYGQAIKTLIAQAKASSGNPVSEDVIYGLIKNRAEELYYRILDERKTGKEFLSKRKFTPLTLMSQWNEMTPRVNVTPQRYVEYIPDQTGDLTAEELEAHRSLDAIPG